VTRLGDRSYAESIREDSTGPEKRYWIERSRAVDSEAPEDTDLWAMKNNRISITPLQLDLGNPQQMPVIEELLVDILKQPLGTRD
jgi:5'-nucleotidase